MRHYNIYSNFSLRLGFCSVEIASRRRKWLENWSHFLGGLCFVQVLFCSWAFFLLRKQVLALSHGSNYWVSFQVKNEQRFGNCAKNMQICWLRWTCCRSATTSPERCNESQTAQSLSAELFSGENVLLLTRHILLLNGDSSRNRSNAQCLWAMVCPCFVKSDKLFTLSKFQISPSTRHNTTVN